MQKISCIIPIYNEKKRVCNILSILTKINNIDEIICVDDASTDGTVDKIKSRFPTIKIIQHKKNYGKAGAVKTGVQESKNNIIFICDADIQGLLQHEIENAIQAFFLCKADMVILRRENAPLHIKLFRGDVLISGERLLKKKDLLKITKNPIKNLTLDCLINKYMMENSKNCIWMPSSATNICKSEKYGFREGILKDAIMYYDMDLIENKFLEQIMEFCIQSGVSEKGTSDIMIDRYKNKKITSPTTTK